MLPGNLLHPLKLDVVGFKEEDHDYHFRVELPEPSCCQSCGYADEKPRKYGKDDQAYRDVPIHGKRCTIWMIRRRYVCKACGSTFRPELKDMDDRRMMTKRLVKHIEVAAVLGNNSDVARTVDGKGAVGSATGLDLLGFHVGLLHASHENSARVLRLRRGARKTAQRKTARRRLWVCGGFTSLGG